MLYYLCKLTAHRLDGKLSFQDTMECAAAFGWLDMLKWLHKRSPNDPEVACVSTDMLTLSLQYRNLVLLDWIHQNYLPSDVKISPDERTTTTSGFIGHLDTTRWLHEHKYNFSGELLVEVASQGHLDVVWVLYEHHQAQPDSSNAMDAAAANGHLEVVQFLHENHATITSGCTTRAMDKSARAGHLPIVQFLHEHRSEGCTSAAVDGAAENDHLEVIKFLHENRRVGCTTTAMTGRLRTGNWTWPGSCMKNEARGIL